RPTILCKIFAADPGLVFDRLENKIVRIDLAMRMRVRNSNGRAFVLKDQNVFDLRMRSELRILFLPGLKQIDNLRKLKLRKCQVVFRAVTNDTRDAGRRLGTK